MSKVLRIVFKVLSCISDVMKRKYVKSTLVFLASSAEDQKEEILANADELYELYKKKLDPVVQKYNVDVDAYFQKKMEGLNIDLGTIVDKQTKEKLEELDIKDAGEKVVKLGEDGKVFTFEEEEKKE